MREQITIPLADGARLHAEAYGDPAAPVTVALLHGWTLDQHIWHRQVSALTAPDGPGGAAGTGGAGLPVRVVVFDARGHGRSTTTRRRTATLGQLGDDLAEVLRAIAPAAGAGAPGDALAGRVVLAGHSLGGMTIMEYAHRHPADFAARVAGLVLVSTTAEGTRHTWYGLPPPLARAVRLAELTGAGVLAYLGGWRPHRMLQVPLRPGLRWLLFGDVADRADVRLATACVAGTPLCAIGGFRSSVGAQRRLATLAALPTVPVTVLVGDRDRITPPPCAEAIAGAVPGAELIVCRGGGHLLTLERADAVTAALVAVTREAVTRVASPG